MPTPVRQTRVTPPSVYPHAGCWDRYSTSDLAGYPDDRSQALPGPGDAGAGVRAAIPIHDVHATIRIADECALPSFRGSFVWPLSADPLSPST